jgi:hypothetical protein
MLEYEQVIEPFHITEHSTVKLPAKHTLPISLTKTAAEAGNNTVARPP